MLDSGHVSESCLLGLTWRASAVDSSIVVLADGEVQRRPWFGDVLPPWFAGSFPYPAEWKTSSLSAQI